MNEIMQDLFCTILILLRYSRFMDANNRPKAVSRSVTMNEDFWDVVDAHAKKVAGDRSTYIRTLVERDMSGASKPADAASPDILSTLVRRLRPDLAPDFEKHMLAAQEASGTSLSQPRVLALLFETFLAGVAGQPIPQPDRPLRLADREKLDAVLRALQLGDHELAQAIVHDAFAHATTPSGSSDAAFIRRWRAELGLPLQSSAGVQLTPGEQAMTKDLVPPPGSHPLAFTGRKSPKK